MAEATEMMMMEEQIPMFRDYYLRFDNETAAQEMLYQRVPAKTEPDPNDPEKQIVTEWMQDEEGNEVWEPRYQNIDNFGLVQKPTGVMLQDEEGMDYPEMSPVDGWHVNVRVLAHEDPSVLEPYKANPDPSTPVRVFG